MVITNMVTKYRAIPQIVPAGYYTKRTVRFAPNVAGRIVNIVVQKDCLTIVVMMMMMMIIITCVKYV